MRLRKIWLLCNLVCIIPGAFAQQFIHPGVLHSEKSLERIKRLVDQKAQPAYGSYEILAKLPEARADYQMKGPFEIISRDGKYGYTKGPSERDFNSAYYNALLWKITGKKLSELMLVPFGRYRLLMMLRFVRDCRDLYWLMRLRLCATLIWRLIIRMVGVSRIQSV